MKHLRKSGGFTLVELVVSIAVASLVTMAATTVLMLALRVNRQTSDTATQQYTVRALLTTMEKAATDGNIDRVVTKLGSWRMIGVEKVIDENGQETTLDRVIFSYDPFYETIYANDIPVLRNVYASNAILEGNLLSISVETKEGIFETTVYCRGGNIDKGGTTPTIPSEPISAVDTFLAKLLGEINSSGVIKNGDYAGKYYSQWYIGDANFGEQWNPSTPWCACYISWALAEMDLKGPENFNGEDHTKWFANVDEFMSHFGELGTEAAPGALVFFNLDNDEEADHMGAVYGRSKDEEGNDIVITIEGNSAGRVAVRSYQLDDPRILGYGLLAGLETE